jgi:O-6-methylguanine DNA methyltransferase
MSANATQRTRATGPSYGRAAGAKPRKETRETIHGGSVATPLGEVHAAVSSSGVIATSLPGETRERFEARLRELAPGAEIARGETPALRDALAQLREFLVGKRARFDLALDLRASAFTRRVLEALAKVPRGETRTYGSLAKAIGSPGAARAVGTALSKNPIPIILPCHRVVGASSIGGFAGKECKLDVKRALLELEQ